MPTDPRPLHVVATGDVPDDSRLAPEPIALYGLAAVDVGARPDDWVPTTEDLEPVLSGTYVRFLDTDGNPLVGKLVTITVDTDNDEIADIIVEEL